MFMDKYSIGVCSYGRKKSQRCPNKMLRNFGGTTLVDILLRKLVPFGDDAFFAGYDKEFEDKCQQNGVRFIQRSEKSVSIDEPQIECLSFVKDVEYDHLLIVNGCLPLLGESIIQRFLNIVIEKGLPPSAAIIKRHNYFFGQHKEPINFPAGLKNLNTKTVRPIFEFANALYFFSRDYFLENERYWDWSKVNLIEFDDGLEFIDVDTEEDFVLAEAVWKELNTLNS